MADAQDIIDRLMSDERFRRVARFSSKVYTDEPILTTGRQMTNYLPDRYREMRAISRWQQGRDGRQGRWLSEAELFFRQGVFMADFEDDCPYHGTFKSYYPTYNAMSDRQLRGYFTWRAAVRRGEIEETSLSFAYVYLYELICGIGVSDPTEGFERLLAFWDTYREFSPEIDRFARLWLQDYVVYHGLDPMLIADQKGMAFDRAVVELRSAQDAALARADAAAPVGGRKRSTAGALLPPDPELEERLARAADALSSYRILDGRFARENPRAVIHVVAAVYVQLCRYYDKHRKAGLIESLFGELAELPYTMFASAVFFDPVRHPDTQVELSPLCRFTCTDGLWSCDRLHGSRARNPKLGEVMRAVDRLMRAAANFEHPLKDEKIPRYLEQIIEREIEAWTAWEQAHTPRRVDIDLTKLSGIRAAAAETREALLVDEEREDVPAGAAADEAAVPGPMAAGRLAPHDEATQNCEEPRPLRPADRDLAAPEAPPAASKPATEATSPTQHASTPSDAPLTDVQARYLAALSTCDRAGTSAALAAADTSEDLLVDVINEALFDLVGDTVIEFGASGPELVEDYLPDIEELLHHA